MLSRTGKIAVNTAFFAALLVPVGAAMVSPGFPPFVRAVLSGDYSSKVQTERLRRATPLWNAGANLYNGIVFDLGVSPNPAQVVLGKDGYIFLGNANYMAYEEDLRRYDPPASQLDKWVDDLAYEEKYVADHGGRMFFIVAPSKGSIYFDKLSYVPPGFAARQTIFDRILDRVRARGLSMIDVRGELIEARKTAETYSKLNSHWTDYGGYVAWQKIAATLEQAAPGLKMAGVGDIESIATMDYGNEAKGLLSLDKPNLWTYPIRKQPLPDYELLARDGTSKSMSGARTEFNALPAQTCCPAAPNPQRALVITDSMGVALSPYWTASFQHVKQITNHVRPPANPLNFEREVDSYKPDFVFYIMVERYFALPLRSDGKHF